MRRTLLLAGLLSCLLVPAALPAGAPAGPPPAQARPVLLAFRGFHGGGGFSTRRRYGSGGLFSRGRRSTGLFGRHGFLGRLVRAAAFAYLLHLFFAHGGLSILLWLLIIGLVVHLVRRRRRRRLAY